MSSKGATNPINPSEPRSHPRGHHAADPRCREIFLDAIELSGPARAAFLAVACNGEPALLRSVQELLALDEAPGDFLSADAATRLDLTTPGDAPATSPTGALGTIGPYTLLRILGEGGFGIVYLAQQHTPVARHVALKVLKPGIDTREVIRRFTLERQSMAAMDHPSIAKVFDAGTTVAGRPYFVMEYVDGQSITEFCDTRNLTIPQRLALMIKVARAVEHAHQRGIIHRDLKPSNILVSLAGNEPLPRIIDFGVAKALAPSGPSATITALPDRAIGTPDYMSPEQAGAPGGVDTRTDVYALGVILFELLAGVRPFDFSADPQNTAPAQWMQQIREREPTSPGRKLSALGDAARAIAIHRATSAPMLVRQLKGELGWIPLKALAKEPARRYASAGAFAEDLERALAHLPLRAGPPSRAYLIRKFIRRHRVIVAAAAAVLLALVIGLVIASRERARADESRDLAQNEAARANIAATAAQRDRTEARLQAYRANLTAAAAAIRVDDAGAARASLDAAPQELRGWEWHHLSSRVSRFAGESPVPRGITVLDPTPDGLALAEVLSDGTQRIRNATTGAITWSVPGKRHSLTVRCSLDGTLMASAPGELLVRRTSDGSVVCRVTTTDAFICGLAIHPNNTHVYTGDTAGRLRCIEIAAGAITWEHQTEGLWIWAVDASPSGAEVAWGDRRSVIVANAATGEIRRTVPVTSDSPGWRDVSSIRYSPDGHTIALCAGISVKTVDANTGTTLHTFRGHNRYAGRLAFDPSGERLVTSSSDHTIRVWDARNGAPLSVLRGHAFDIFSVGFACAGTRLFSTSDDGSIKSWDPAPRPDVRVFSTQLSSTEAGRRITFNRAGTRLLLSTSDRVQFYDTLVDKLSPESDLCRGCYAHAVLSPDASTIAVANADGEIRLIDPLTLNTLATIKAHSGHLTRLAFSPDGAFLASAGQDGDVAVFSAAQEQLSGCAALARQSSPGAVHYALVFTPDGETILLLKDFAGVDAWSWRTGATRALQRDPERQLIACTLSPDGNTVAATSLTGMISTCDLATGTPIRSQLLSESGLRGVSFSPDGTRLAVAGYDGAVHILDSGTLQELVALVGHEGWVDTVIWSADGTRLASSDWEGTVRIWER